MLLGLMATTCTAALSPCTATVSTLVDLKSALTVGFNSVICISAGTINLAATDALFVTQSSAIEIRGIGTLNSDVVIDAKNLTTIFAITSTTNITVTLRHLTLRKGYATNSGGCIGVPSTATNGVNLVVDDVWFDQCTTSNGAVGNTLGGGIGVYSPGLSAVSVLNSKFTSCTA